MEGQKRSLFEDSKPEPQVVGSVAFDNDTSGDISFTIDYSAISEGDTVQINYSLDS